jgi:hypothetical protein
VGSTIFHRHGVGSITSVVFMATLMRFRRYFAKKFSKLLGPNKKKKQDSKGKLGQETTHAAGTSNIFSFYMTFC